MYRIYEIINGTIYFKELIVRIETSIYQHSQMVDLIIQEK